MRNIFHLLIPSFLIVSLAIISPVIVFAQGVTNQESSQAPVITPAEYAVLDYALSLVLMTRKDLGFKKNYVDDEYRTKIVQRHLDDPMLVPVECDAISRDILDHDKQPTYILKKAAGLVDREPDIPVNMEFHRPWEAIGFSDAAGIVGFSHWDNIALETRFMSEEGMSQLNDAISQYITALATAGDRVAPAFSGLTDEEMGFLYEYAPRLLHEDVKEDEEIGVDHFAKAGRLLDDTKLVDWKGLYGAAMIASAATAQFADRV